MSEITKNMDMIIFLKGNIPSSKNSKNFTKIKDKTLLVNSTTVLKYLSNFEYQYFDNKNKKKFKEMIKDKVKPYQIKFTFIRDSKRKFDYINAAQLPCDLMTRHGWIVDDNCDEIIPSFSPYKYDKNNPGVLIEII